MRRGFIVKGNSGFTLVEMVVVLFLVIILAAAAVPVYTDYIDNVRRREGEAALYTILTAAKTYYYRNGDSFTGSTCGCGAGACDDIWLNTAEICNHWTISTYTPAGQNLTIRVDGTGDYSGLWVQLVFNAAAGTTTITKG